MREASTPNQRKTTLLGEVQVNVPRAQLPPVLSPRGSRER